MDIVYTLGRGSKYNDFELRMSLRSLEENLSSFDKVWIVGHLPGWIQNVEHIPAEDTNPISDRNIFEKLKLACSSEVTEDFLFVNDDHYLLSYFKTENFPYYCHGTLEEYVKRRPSIGDAYGKRAKNSLEYLKRKGLPIKHFDIHYPIIYNKTKFLEVMDMDWANSSGYILKSIYANSLKIEGVEIDDHKMNQIPRKPILVMSTFPNIRGAVLRFLQEEFRKQSRFEKTGI